MASGEVRSAPNSDSEEEKEEVDANLPSREECETRCQMFAEVTGTDSALAMFYLQDRDWDLQKSISDYFADQDRDVPDVLTKSQERSQTPLDNKGKRGNPEANKTSLLTSTQGRISTDSDCLTLGPSVLQPEQEGVVRVLSWNIDGLDPDNLQSRTEGMCAVLLQEHPDVIFLQEVVHRSLGIIKARLENGYTVVTGDLDCVNTPGAYFTAMLLKKDSVVMEKARVMDFPGSLMCRDLMEVQCQVKRIPVVLLTSHLESTKEYGAERCRQLKTAFDQMLASPQDRTVIFGGDLNLRDKELSGASAKPSGVYDLWECTGKRPEAKFTWDLMVNDNKQMGGKFQPRCRFDRLYIRHGHSQDSSPTGSSAGAKGNVRPISSYFTSPHQKKQSSSGRNIGDTACDDNQNRCEKEGTTSPDLRTEKHVDRQVGETKVKTTGPRLKPVYFELVGIQRLSSCRRFPSDHWGILAHLQVVDKRQN